MSLVTRCPKCSSAFRVVADQLRLHDGLVRCGACSHVFDGFACLDNELPTLTNKVTDPEPNIPMVEEFLSVPQEPDPHASSPEPSAFGVPAFSGSPISSSSTTPVSPMSRASSPPVVMRGRSPAATPDGSKPLSAQENSAPGMPVNDFERMVQLTHRLAGELTLSAREPLEDRPEPRLFRGADPDAQQLDSTEPVIGEARLRDPHLAAPGAMPPPFMEREDEPGMLSTIAWGVACLLAFLLLTLQVLYVYRNEIGTAIPSLRSPLNLMCARFGCEVSYVRQLERITFTASSLQQTDAPGADGSPPRYLLKFSMRNRYDKPQPWPSLLLSLTDAGGTVVVRKMVLPHEYLPRTLIDQPFAAGQELNLDLPLVVRGAQVQGFQLEKFFP